MLITATVTLDAATHSQADMETLPGNAEPFMLGCVYHLLCLGMLVGNRDHTVNFLCPSSLNKVLHTNTGDELWSHPLYKFY